MKKVHVVIVSYNWPPRNAVGTHRPYSWAKCWAELGIIVTVLTAKKRAFDAPLDLDLPAIKGVEVIEVPYGRELVRVDGMFLRTSVGRSLKRIREWARGSAGINIDPRRAWLKAAREYASKLAMSADYVVSTSGPSSAHELACMMKQENPALRWIADYRDLWSQNHVANMSRFERRKTLKKECSTVGRYADLVTVVSEDMVSKLREITRSQVIMIPNGFDEAADVVRNRLGNLKPRVTSPPIKIVYTGTLYRGKQDPEPLLRALAGLEAEGRITTKDFTVAFYGSRVSLAQELASNPEYAKYIDVKGHVGRSVALAAQRNADLLLILESPDEEARGVVTGKIFEYLCAGVPILSLGSKRDYEIPKILGLTRTGISLEDDSEDIRELLMRLVKSQRLDFFEPDIEYILRYSRKSQAISLLEAMKSIAPAKFQ